MKIGILGTGMVVEAPGTKLEQLGHQVRMGSRTANNESPTNRVPIRHFPCGQLAICDATDTLRPGV